MKKRKGNTTIKRRFAHLPNDIIMLFFKDDLYTIEYDNINYYKEIISYSKIIVKTIESIISSYNTIFERKLILPKYVHIDYYKHNDGNKGYNLFSFFERICIYIFERGEIYHQSEYNIFILYWLKEVNPTIEKMYQEKRINIQSEVTYLFRRFNKTIFTKWILFYKERMEKIEMNRNDGKRIYNLNQGVNINKYKDYPKLTKEDFFKMLIFYKQEERDIFNKMTL